MPDAGSLSRPITRSNRKMANRNTTNINSNTTTNRKHRKRRRARRGCLESLATSLLDPSKNVVVITGAGLSVASGVRPFRGSTAAIWSNVIWTKSTRASFRQDPLAWYNNFWLPHFSTLDVQRAQPNEGHLALQQLQELCPNIRLITQNIDGLHGTTYSETDPSKNRLIEAHGRLGFYKCIPAEDSDTDSDSDEEDERRVHLGHRRKSRALRKLYQKQQQNMSAQADSEDTDSLSKTRHSGSSDEASSIPFALCTSSSSVSSSESSDSHNHKPHHTPCRFELDESIPLSQIQPPHVRPALALPTSSQRRPELTDLPRCPDCNNVVLPQALLFDEGYHSHGHYQFEQMEEWLSNAHLIMFVGTSFAVRLTQVALEHARTHRIQVYNFNIHDLVQPTAILDATNVVGPAHETLPRLWETVCELQQEQMKE